MSEIIEADGQYAKEFHLAKIKSDKDKLIKFAQEISNLSCPELTRCEAKEILKSVNLLLFKVVVYINEKIEKL